MRPPRRVARQRQTAAKPRPKSFQERSCWGCLDTYHLWDEFKYKLCKLRLRRHSRSKKPSEFECDEGEYCEGKRHGRGTWFSANGSRYEGEFCEGKQHGRGTYKCVRAGGPSPRRHSPAHDPPLPLTHLHPLATPRVPRPSRRAPLAAERARRR